MAYVVASEVFSEAAVESSIDVSMPAGHQANDIVLVIAGQDVGTGTISFPGTWTTIGPAQAAEQGQRSVAAWKLMASSTEADITISSGLAEQWEVLTVLIRKAHTTSPVDVVDRASLTSTNTPQAPAITTNYVNALVLHVLSYDGGIEILPDDISAQSFVNKTMGSGVLTMLATRKNQAAIGAITRPSYLSHNSTEGGSFWSIAIRDDGDAQMGPECNTAHEVIRRYGRYHAYEGTTLQALSNLAATTIAGVAVGTIAPAVAVTSQLQGAPYYETTSLTFTSSEAFDAWLGATHTITSTDMRGCVFGVRYGMNTISSTTVGAQGFIVVFEDNVGAWAAFTLSQRAGLALSNSTYYTYIHLETAEQLDSGGGTINWQYITRIGYAHVRPTVAGAVSRSQYLGDSVLLRRSVMVGGSASSPASAVELYDLVERIHGNEMSTKQGKGQILAKSNLQFGDGATPSFIDLTSTAVEFPLRPTASLRRRFWKAGADAVEIRIKAGASDTVNAKAGVLATDLRQLFVLDATSSASATYDFGGLVVDGFAVDLLAANVTVNGVTFSRCHQITLDGALLNLCTISDSVATSAVLAGDPGDISNCSFYGTGTGHALELTTPGTYTFAGNTFDGYGADGTTDAAIYNNSGGLVTLNITGGGGTPTVKDAGGSTTVINNNVTITVDNLVVGSAIRVEKVSDGSLVEFRTAASTSEVFSVAASINYRIKVRKGTSAPKYAPWQTNTGVITGDTTVFAAQVLDPIA